MKINILIIGLLFALFSTQLIESAHARRRLRAGLCTANGLGILAIRQFEMQKVRSKIRQQKHAKQKVLQTDLRRASARLKAGRNKFPCEKMLMAMGGFAAVVATLFAFHTFMQEPCSIFADYYEHGCCYLTHDCRSFNVTHT